MGESVVANKEIQEKQSKNASKASKHKREEKQELKKRQAEEKNKILHPCHDEVNNVIKKHAHSSDEQITMRETSAVKLPQ